jgi:cupin 2 domain-containing protein
MRVANIYEGLAAGMAEETFEAILRQGELRLERIVSKGHATPAGEWYDQESDEWVLLLAGSAGLLVEGEGKTIVLGPGDHLLLPAHCRHRVEWTDPATETVWLALHYRAQE